MLVTFGLTQRCMPNSLIRNRPFFHQVYNGQIQKYLLALVYSCLIYSLILDLV